MLFSLSNIPVVTLDGTLRVVPESAIGDAGSSIPASPRAPVKCSSAQKKSIRRKIQGKALDFNDPSTTGGSPKSAWMEESVTAGTPKQDSFLTFVATPDKAPLQSGSRHAQATITGQQMPIIYGSGVTMDSPDPFSKYHDGPGPVQANSGNYGACMNANPVGNNDFISIHSNYYNSTPVKSSCDYNAHTPCTPRAEEVMDVQGTPGTSNKCLPLVYGSGVSMDSPDPFSKYHDTKTLSHVELQPSAYDRVNEFNAPSCCNHGGFLVPGIVNGSRDAQEDAGIETLNHNVSPSGVDLLSCSPPCVQEKESRANLHQASAICRTGGFGFRAEADIEGRINPQPNINKVLLDENASIADLRRAIGTRAHQVQKAPKSIMMANIEKSPTKSRSCNDLNAQPVHSFKQSEQEVSYAPNKPRVTVRKTLDPLESFASNPNGMPTPVVASIPTTQSIGARPGTGVNPVGVGRRPTGYSQGHLCCDISISQQNVLNPSQSLNAHPQQPLMHRPAFVPTPPSAPRMPASIGAATLSSRLKEGISGTSITLPGSRPSTANSIIENGLVGPVQGVCVVGSAVLLSAADNTGNDNLVVSVPQVRSGSVQRRGRSYVESKEYNSPSSASPNSAELSPVEFGSSETLGVPKVLKGKRLEKELVVIGDACSVPVSASRHTTRSQTDLKEIVVTGRPITAKSNSPAKEMVANRCDELLSTVLFVDEGMVIVSNVPPAKSRTRVTTVSLTVFSAVPKHAKKKKSAHRLPYQPLRQLCSIPEIDVCEHMGVPSWLTVFAGYGIENSVREMMNDVDALFASFDDNEHTRLQEVTRRKKKSSSPTQKQPLDSTLILESQDKENVQSNLQPVMDESDESSDSSQSRYRPDTYGMWMSNQTIALSMPTRHISNTSVDIFAAIRANNFDLIKTKIEAGLWTHSCFDAVGNSPLIVSVFCGIGKIIRYLIKAGAALNSQNRFGNTALHFAQELCEVAVSNGTIQGFEKVVNYLLKKGADTSLVNKMNMRYDQRLDSKCLKG
jgi:hypothetical protein